MLFHIELRWRDIKTLHHMQQHNTKKANIRITDVRKALLPQFTKGAQTRAQTQAHVFRQVCEEASAISL